jgi:hypothetical protein
MNDPALERIAVTFSPSADDYARYAAAVERRSRSWSTFNVSVAVFFSAIPVALLFRVLAAICLGNADAIEMAGQFTLFAFVLGVLTAWIGSSIVRRIALKRYYETTLASPEPRTIELDHTGITTTAKATQSKWQWIVVSRCTLERDLLLMWISPSTALAIPTRSFASEAACGAALAFVRARLSEAGSTSAQADAAKREPA